MNINKYVSSQKIKKKEKKKKKNMRIWWKRNPTGNGESSPK